MNSDDLVERLETKRPLSCPFCGGRVDPERCVGDKR